MLVAGETSLDLRLCGKLTVRTLVDRFAHITLRELTMMRFMNAVTDKPEWAKKVTLPPIRYRVSI